MCPSTGRRIARPDRVGSRQRDVATPVPEGAVQWNRVNLGFVSAYILVRDGEAAVVDTGVAGSEDDIENALTAIGLEWEGR